MLAFSKLLLLFAFALSVSALATPHVVRSPHAHRAIAARVAAPVASPAVGPYGSEAKVVKPRKMRRRGDTGRCKSQTQSSSASATPSSTSSTPVFSSTSSDYIPSSTSSTPQPTSSQSEPAVAPANVGSSPSSSSEPETPTSTSTPTPTTTSTPEPQPESSTSSDTPAPTSTTSSASGSSSSGSDSSTPSFLQGTQSGEATYYDIGLGACGVTNSGSDRVAAVSKLLFDAFPGYSGANSNNNPVCGKSVTLSYNGKSTTVTIEDRCEACALTDLDLSQAAFEDLADTSLGRIDMTWVWVD